MSRTMSMMRCATSIYVLLSVYLQTTVPLMAAEEKPDGAWQRLLEYWRWQRFWYGSSDADRYYSVGAKDQVRLFWVANGGLQSIGICSQAGGLCQFYPDIDKGWLKIEKSIANGTPRAKLEDEFIRDTYDQFPPMQIGDRRAAVMKVVYPAWQVPRAVQDRKVRPADELARLIKLVRCPEGKYKCQSRLLVPFYTESDPRVLIYRECQGACNGSNAVIVMPQLIDNQWFLGATNLDSSKDFVERTRQQIERSVMWRVEE